MKRKKEPPEWQEWLLLVALFPVAVIVFIIFLPLLILVDIPIVLAMITDKYCWRTYTEVKLLTDKKKSVAGFLLRQAQGDNRGVQCRLRKERELKRIAILTKTEVPSASSPSLGEHLLYYEYRYRPAGGGRQYSFSEVFRLLRHA